MSKLLLTGSGASRGSGPALRVLSSTAGECDGSALARPLGCPPTSGFLAFPIAVVEGAGSLGAAPFSADRGRAAAVARHRVGRDGPHPRRVGADPLRPAPYHL